MFRIMVTYANGFSQYVTGGNSNPAEILEFTADDVVTTVASLREKNSKLVFTAVPIPS